MNTNFKNETIYKLLSTIANISIAEDGSIKFNNIPKK